jgi:hypothetical protein
VYHWMVTESERRGEVGDKTLLCYFLDILERWGGGGKYQL